MTDVTRARFLACYPNARVFGVGFNIELARTPEVAGPVTPSLVDRPWGAEVWLAFTNTYVFKLLIIESGQRFSQQRHHQKHETWLFRSGEGTLELNGETRAVGAGELILIPPGTVHRLTASPAYDLELFEVSTTELTDVERLADDFGRPKDVW